MGMFLSIASRKAARAAIQSRAWAWAGALPVSVAKSHPLPYPETRLPRLRKDRCKMAPPTEAQNGWVARVLGFAGGGAQQPSTARREADGIRLAKGVLLWNETRSHAREQVKALQAAIRGDMAGHPEYGVIDENAMRIDEIFNVLDDRLTAKLGEVQGTADPSRKQKLIVECRSIVADYETF